ncbi:40S ribosomal protein S21 like [Verticillium longisporum]|nr:40S ribosomal protein S21 like [Verticillium longisporum]
MENDRGEIVDLYAKFPLELATTAISRGASYKCTTQKNGRAVQGENHVYALSGFVRAMGESDDAMNRLAQRDGLLKSVWSGQR